MSISYENILESFYDSCSSKKALKLGVEYELICFSSDTMERVFYNSKPGIKDILYFIKNYYSAEAVFEEDNIIAVNCPDFKITIEPGGQLEASFVPCDTLFELDAYLKKYINLLAEIEKELKISIFACSVDPFVSPDEVELVPKQRYRIMKNYLKQKGTLSDYMMKMTTSMQFTIDYTSEEDALLKFNKAIEWMPLFKIIQNSKNCVSQKLYNRNVIWQNTDVERTQFYMKNNFGVKSFRDYIQMLGKIPMMFFIRDMEYIVPATNLKFDEFIKDGWGGYRSNMSDWYLQMNTVFPPVRFNNSIIELRFFDNGLPLEVLAMAALVKGLFYRKDLKILKFSGVQDMINAALESLSMSGEKIFLLDWMKGNALFKTCFLKQGNSCSSIDNLSVSI